MTASRWQVFGVVSFYMSAALVMVFVNKAVLNSTPDIPLSFLFIQLTIAVILLHGAALCSKKVELPRIEWDVAQKLFPVVSVNIIGLVFNTLCLRAVDASFFQIARGLVLPFTIAASSIVSSSRPSLKTILAASIVTIGFFIGVSPSASFFSSRPTTVSPMLAITYGVLSSLMIALHAVLIKSSYPHVDNSSIKLAYWSNLGSAAMLLPFIWLNGETVLLMKPRLASDWHVFVVGSGVTGLFGFLLCMAGLLSIKVTSPTTHMFSSAARSVLQTLFAAMLFGDIITANRGLSILVITLGTLYYTWIKSGGPPKPAAQPAAPVQDEKLKEPDLEKQPLEAEPETAEREAPSEKH